MTCPACGAENRDGARFCDACGTTLAVHAADRTAARKVVTIVFADLIGSTALHERLDPESVRRVMERYHRAVRVPIEAHGGIVVQLLGDGVMCAFGVPRVAEDDALRAVRAAVGIQHAFREFARAERAVVGATGLRVAVNTGEVVVSDEYAAGIGDPLNVAARLQQEAHDGDVLIGEATERLVRERVTLEPFGTFTLKGRAETVTAYRVVSLERPTGVAATPFVGRDEELGLLLAVHDAAVAAPGPRLGVLLGSPGLGKSRLLAEVARRVEDRAAVLAANCDAAGGATFAPLAEAVRAFFRLDDGAGADAVRAAITAAVPGEESARIGAGIVALLAGAPAPPEETFFVVRRLLAALAATQPVVLAIDDLQWAEPLLLDLVEHLIQWSTGVPLLVLVAARPELRDTRSSLATAGGLVADVVTLGGLDAGAATRLAANVIGAAELPAAIAGRVLATSEGNPLFVGELVRMLVHDGVLKREGARWTTGIEVSALEMPPTIQALLAARIERLQPDDRTVLERAAVVGRQFSRAAVAHLLPREITDLDARVEALRRSELIERDTGWLLGEPVLRFHHVLIRDAAYRRVLKGTRAELHARLAEWIEDRVGDSIEHDETLGWHLEQAHQNLRELGPLDADGRALGERAARYLAAAGRRALGRDDLPLAATLLGRALERLDPEDPARADLALDWCEALLAAGDVGPARRAVAELARFSGHSDRLRAWHTCFAGELAGLTDPQALRATVEAVAAAADALVAAGDAAGEAKAHAVHAAALARLGAVGACEAALDRALAAARRGHDRRRANAVLSGAPRAVLWGPSPVTRASGRCLDVVRVLRITQGSPAVEAVALRCQAVLEALRGRTEAARHMLASSRRMVEELGITQRLLEADVAAGQIALLEGDAVAAERSLREAYGGLRTRGLRIDAAQAAALLGRALLALGRDAEAEAVSHESEALAGDDLRAAIGWRGVRAEALAQRGEHTAAVDLARGAVDIAAATDALLDHAEARLALGAVLRAAGRRAEADAEEARAVALWEAKGATLLVARARGVGTPAERQGPAAGGHPVPAHSVRRRVRANAAAENVQRFDAAIAAGDIDAVGALLTDDYELVDHPNGIAYGRSGVLDYLERMLGGKGLRFAHELVATLGTSLALCRGSMTLDEVAEDDGTAFGESTYEFYVLVEGSADQHRRVEQFATDHLGDALARSYERYAELLPEGPARKRAAATAHSVEALLGPPDRWPFTPDAEAMDHRTVGFGWVRGGEAVVQAIRALLQLSDDFAARIDDILALRPDALLVRWTSWGTVRMSGGGFERTGLMVWLFGADGLLTRWEQFDAERDAEAFARLDELTPQAAEERFANTASRAYLRFVRSVRERDWSGLVATLGPTPGLDDRRHLVRVRVSGAEYFAHLKMIFSTTWNRWDAELLGTRGARLALFRERIAGTAGGIDFVHEQLALEEADRDGLLVEAVSLDLDDLDAAYTELDARYAAGEAARHEGVAAAMQAFRRAFASRDWDALGAQFSPGLVVNDHRLLGWEALFGPSEYVASLRSLVDLAPDAHLRLDHVRTSATALLWVGAWVGSHEGGTFETPWVTVSEHDAAGRVLRVDQYDLGDLDAAWARFGERR